MKYTIYFKYTVYLYITKMPQTCVSREEQPLYKCMYTRSVPPIYSTRFFDGCPRRCLIRRIACIRSLCGCARRIACTCIFGNCARRCSTRLSACTGFSWSCAGRCLSYQLSWQLNYQLSTINKEFWISNQLWWYQVLAKQMFGEPVDDNW